jgi:hypothetical protein
MDTLHVQKILQQTGALKIWFCRITLKEEEKRGKRKKGQQAPSVSLVFVSANMHAALDMDAHVPRQQ